MLERQEEFSYYMEALNALVLNDWDWAYVCLVAEHDLSRKQTIDGKKYTIPERVDISVYWGDVVRRIEYEYPVGGLSKVWEHILKRDGRRVFKQRINIPYVSEIRIYQPHHKVPNHIKSRGVEVEWD